jgi:hypothetical protein
MRHRTETLEDVLGFLDEASLGATRKRDMASAIKRVCEMAATTPAGVSVEAPRLRELLCRIRPAAHGITAKSFSNLKSLLSSALQLAGVLDPLGRGGARQHPVWGAPLAAVADDKRLSNGLAAFANWCAAQGISPGEVDDAAVQQFLVWLEAKTLHPEPRDLVRRVPNVWNEAAKRIAMWPDVKLATLLL